MTVLKFPVEFAGPKTQVKPIMKMRPDQPEIPFIFDVKDGKVYCAECKGECRRIPLPDFVITWCPEPFCSNVLELRKKPGEPYELYSYGEALGGPADDELIAELEKMIGRVRDE